MNIFINFVACKNQNITKQLSRPKFMNEQNASIKPYVIGLDLGIPENLRSPDAVYG